MFIYLGQREKLQESVRACIAWLAETGFLWAQTASRNVHVHPTAFTLAICFMQINLISPLQGKKEHQMSSRNIFIQQNIFRFLSPQRANTFHCDWIKITFTKGPSGDMAFLYQFPFNNNNTTTTTNDQRFAPLYFHTCDGKVWGRSAPKAASSNRSRHLGSGSTHFCCPKHPRTLPPLQRNIRCLEWPNQLPVLQRIVQLHGLPHLCQT